MKILEAHDYIIGKRFTKKVKEPVRCTQEMIDNFIEACKSSSTAAVNLKILESAKAFYDCEKVVAKLIPVAEREEVFYAMKAEKFSPIIPAKFLFLFNKVKEQLESFNLLTVGLTSGDINTLFAEGTLAEGYSVRDVIKSLYQKEFEPVSESVRGIQIKDYWEVCIEKENVIIFIPDKLRARLSDDDLEEITIGKDALMVYGKPLRFLSSDYYGVVRNLLDMRKMI